MTQDANDLLMGSGAPSAKFPTIGHIVSGTVLREPEARQQKEFRTGTLETWKDGSPKMAVVVQMSTTERDPERPDDDGTRTLWIQGKHLTDAVRQAVRQSGANGIHTGGVLTVQYVADGPAENGLNPPKLYAANYQPPAASFAGVAGPATQQAAAAPAQHAVAQPAVQNAVAPAVHQAVLGTPPAAAVQQAIPGTVPACPPGVDPAMWARMEPAQRDRVLAAMAPAQPATADIPF